MKTTTEQRFVNIHPSVRATSRRAKGFTLTELLVVILIIAVLSALGFFAITRARNAALTAADMTTLRNLGPALASAAADEGRYPFSYYNSGLDDFTSGSCWMDPVRVGMGLHYSSEDTYTYEDAEPFISKRVNASIPSDPLSGKLRSMKHFAATEAVMPMHDAAAVNAGYLGVPLAGIKRPAELVLMVDAPAQNEDDVYQSSHSNLWAGPMRSRWYIGQTWAAADNEDNRHVSIDSDKAESVIDFRNDGKAHVLFVDGHVESLRPSEFVYGMFSNAY
ncbi:MAG: type II secretion system protein [Verrucomicrobiales bacterium]|nr:prepilin-type N-terminal cleavage/methylation domain-containing protein [Verrucomicrobiota bacterium JB025]